MAGSEIRALIVDDETALRGILKIALTYFGVKVVGEASNGVEGVARYRELQPNVVLMDINMPEMDGLTCLVEVLKINPEAVVLLMTASEDSNAMDQGRERGAKGFLRKPLVMEQLHRDIVNTLRVHFAKEKGLELNKEYLNYNLAPGFRPADEGKHIAAPPVSGATRRIREQQLKVEQETKAHVDSPVAEGSQHHSVVNVSALGHGTNRESVDAQKRAPTPAPAPLPTAKKPVQTVVAAPDKPASESVEEELARVRLELDRRNLEVAELRLKLETTTDALRRMADELGHK